jgi:SNF2 family DNA or RNA helicase
MLAESDTESALRSERGFVVKDYTQEEIGKVVGEFTDHDPDIDKDLIDGLPSEQAIPSQPSQDKRTDTPTKQRKPLPQPTPQKELIATALDQTLFHSNEGLMAESKQWVLELDTEQGQSDNNHDEEQGELDEPEGDHGPDSLEANWKSAGIDLHEIIDPTYASLQVNTQHSKWLDNIAYQYDDTAGACKRLNIKNPLKPKIEGMRPASSLFEWQPPAIAAMLKMKEDPWLDGTLVADDVGLGKTFTTIGFLLKVSLPKTLIIPGWTSFWGRLPQYLS